MELNAVTRSVEGIFSVNKKYVVPRFQREYSWTKEEISEFWEDIVQQISCTDGVPATEEYFIGCIVLVGEESKPEYLIVDGQQRLTTLTILIRSIVNRLKELGDEDAAVALYENAIEGKDNDGKKYFKLANESPKPFFQNELQSIKPEGIQVAQTEEEKLLLEAFSTFSKNLQAYKIPGLSPLDSVKVLRSQVLNYLKIILVTAKNEDDAYTIFETLNARGLSLTSVDLIKNWIFKNYAQTHPNDNAKSIWGEMRKKISEFSDLETFFRHYWNSKYSFASDDRLYKSFNDARKQGKISTAKDFLIELRDASELYRKIGAPKDGDWTVLKEKAVGRAFSLINQYKVTQVRPFLLALLACRKQGVVGQSDFVRIVVNLENFHFIFSRVCQDRASGLEGKYTRAAKNLYAAGGNKAKAKQVLVDLNSYLIGKRPGEQRIIEAVKALKFENGVDAHKKTIQIAFAKIEQHLQGTAEKVIGEFSLEHVQDQSSKMAWVGDIGNLLPLDEGLNNKIKAGATFVKKKLIYKKSALKVVHHFLDENSQDVWSLLQSRKWAKELSSLLVKATELSAI